MIAESLRRSVCYGVATAVAAVLLFGGSQAYAAMPWWHLSTLSAPAKAPGGESEIVVEASNLGDAYVNGFEHPVTLVDKLPVGVTATAIYPEGGGGQIGVDFASAFFELLAGDPDVYLQRAAIGL